MQRSPFACIILCGIAVALVGTQCAAHRSSTEASPSPSDYTGSVVVGKGVACEYLGHRGPPSYRVSDIGKPGVPRVDKSDLQILRIMMRDVHPSTLRFAYLDGKFSVFDAVDGPCSPTPVGVLTDRSCNAIYVPFDANGNIGYANGCIEQPRPWIPNDRGNPHGLDWSTYDNSH